MHDFKGGCKMSDAMTDIAKDIKRENILEKISFLEYELIESLSKEKAISIIKLWNAYVNVSSGYSENSNELLAQYQIYKLKECIKNGNIDWLKEKHSKKNINEFNGVIAVGNGFISKGDIEDWILNILYKNFGNPHYGKFKISLKIENIEKISCKNCPYIGNNCGIVLCNSENGEELAKIKKLTEGAKKNL